MNKFRELLFLKKIKGLGKTTISKKYLSELERISNIDDLVEMVKLTENKVSSNEIDFALKTSEKIYNDIINDSDIKVITVFDDEYPSNLHSMDDKKPLVLYVKGDASLLIEQSIAVIGTRHPSEWSQKVEENLVMKILKESDNIIVSGLALGCDKIAHETTVKERRKTVAVLPSGVNVITPASHKKLAKEILELGGCIVSEYEPNYKVTKSSYVERDAIVAALVNGVFVVECGIKSGTMHTVNYANEYGRKVACYYIDDSNKGTYNGNKHLLDNGKAMKVSDTDELIIFLKEISNIVINSENEGKQLSIMDLILTDNKE
ncbi:MAG: DNA-protecting protein DprA [Eubacterium sp.]|nr:DNA-protecting protein DprA [Eubacterium sp.]